MKCKYNITVEVHNECGFSGDYGKWLGYTDIQAHGDTIAEVLKTATIGICDQDGGEMIQQGCEDDWMIEMILHEIYLKYGELYDFNNLNSRISS